MISAEGLKDLKHINTMDPFTIVSLCGRDEQRTPVHWNGGIAPRWVYRVAFPLDEAAARADHRVLKFNIRTKKVWRDEQDVAWAEVSVKELLEMQGDGNPMVAMRHKVRLQPQGDLEFSYYFSDALPTPQATDQDRPPRIGGRWLMSFLPCVGNMAVTAVNAAEV